jgi:hypothetical protein
VQSVKTELREIQEVHGDDLKVLKHVPTRWLLLRKCVERLLLILPALKEYFYKEKKDDSGRPTRVYRFVFLK